MPAGRNALLDHFYLIEGIDPARNSAKKRAIAGVAQLVEHPICNRAVGSSSLSASTTILIKTIDLYTVLQLTEIVFVPIFVPICMSFSNGFCRKKG